MRILLVDDDVRLATIVRQSLIDRGHVVDAELDGRSALDAARSDVYDAIVLDWMLPHIDGVSILRALRREGTKTPVLIVTARDGTDDVIAGLDAGADDYVRKPFALGELEARLRAITRRDVSELPAQQLVVADVVMDLASRRGGAATAPSRSRRAKRRSSSISCAGPTR